MHKRLATVLALLAVPTCGLTAQTARVTDKITSPKQFFGKEVGADRFLANYTQLTAYWRKLESESPRMVLEEIGTTSYGQTMLTAIVTSPANHAHLEELRRINERIARAKDSDPDEVAALIQEGKPVIWIDAGMHATESVAAQNILELAYRLTSKNDAETRRILDEVICLITPANPDGMEMIANAYMATGRVGGLPVLYQRYIGHDNNRDYYAVNMPETRAICRMLYRRWFPQVVYNHHQSAPRGTVIFTPPFRDPFNYNVDPLVVRGIEIVSAHMNWRFTREEKPGVISRTGAPYSTWWNGGLRTTAYFHNMIGILTEVFGHPTPRPLSQSKSRRLPYSDYPLPIETQKLWHARQTIEYLQTSNYAILDYASRYGDELQHDMWRIGRRAIEAARRDTWTETPRLVALMDGDRDNKPFEDPATRDARAYLIPRDQEDFAAATRLAQALIDNGVEVHRASRDFSFAGRSYDAGSFVVRCDQAFRAHVRDMFEPQWHPDDIAATGEPIRPYDSAGWTLAMQLGVAFDRAFDNPKGPFELIDDRAATLPGRADDASVGWLLDCSDSNAYRALHRLLAKDVPVHTSLAHWTGLVESKSRFTAFVPRDDVTRTLVPKLAKELGVDFVGLEAKPNLEPQHLRKLRKPRVGLFDVFGGNMPTGWTQWVLEQFEFPTELVYGDRITRGNLRADFDVLVFMTGLPSMTRRPRGRRPSSTTDETLEKLAKALPPFENWSDIAKRRTILTRGNSVEALKAFVKEGGTIVGIGESARSLVAMFDLPFRTGIRVAKKATESGEPEYRQANRSEFFIPGSLIRIAYEKDSILGSGRSTNAADQVAMFRRSPVFDWNLPADKDAAARARARISTPIRYADTDQLASGWAIGQEMLAGKVAAIHAEHGKGNVFVFGPDMLYRGQPWFTFHPVFRAILVGSGTKVSRIE